MSSYNSAMFQSKFQLREREIFEGRHHELDNGAGNRRRQQGVPRKVPIPGETGTAKVWLICRKGGVNLNAVTETRIVHQHSIKPHSEERARTPNLAAPRSLKPYAPGRHHLLGHVEDAPDGRGEQGPERGGHARRHEVAPRPRRLEGGEERRRERWCHGALADQSADDAPH